jgi:deazaflavin-dependent oxidoreductase (nitroreductase family)
MGSDKQIRGPLLFRVGVSVLLALSGAALAFLSLPRMAKRHMDRVRQSSTMMRVLRWYNGTRLKHAGSQRSATAILTHVGRRSGRTYEAPLGAAPYGDGFVLSLAYGPGTDWCRNVMAAGTSTLAWKGQTYELVRPEIISGPQILQAWPIWERIALRAAGIQDFLWLHRKKE